MSYVRRTLGNKEAVLFSTGYHWLYWLGVILLTSPFCATALMAIAYGSWYYLLLAILLVPFYFGLVRFVHGIALEVAVTSDRFVKKTGFVSINTEEMSIDKIEEVNVEETILGRIFGYGTVSVHGTGAGDIKVYMVTDPVNLRREIQTAREHVRNKGES
jgi:uncharacterized membrane protein YdbT with pleckstrin-like domain